MLRVALESAAALPKKKLGSPDPVTSVVFKDQKKKTKSISNEVNPVWNETLEFDLKGVPLDSSSYIDVIVKDFETLGKDKFIGSVKVSLKDLAGGQVKSLPLKNSPLLDESGKNIGATISMVIAYEPPVSSVSNAPDQPDGGGHTAGDADGTDAGVTSAESGPRLKISSRKPHSLPNKAQDFQIRVRVIEGRQLSGNNIRPVVKVHMCSETHRTRIKKGNNPYFDEIFFFNVNMLPSDLFDEHISFRVYNASSFRADSLMGEFKIDVSYIYEETAHCLMKKWVLLSDPDDSSSGAKGYLKVSMFVLGSGDEAPVEKKEQDNDKDDVESNLLLPAGVSLRWVTLNVKVFRAEDIPQMDDSISQTIKEVFGGHENKKNLVDPFVEVSFAGKKLTEEKWTFYHSSRSHIHRASCVAMEVERLNLMLVERKIGKSILGKVHLAMVRYHEGERFCEKDEEWDQESALYHLETAAMCGELEAIVALGQCYLQLPHHILPEIELHASEDNKKKGFRLLLQAAEAGDRPSMILVARMFDTGLNLPSDRTTDWSHAVHWYDCALKMTDYDEGGEFDGMQDEPRYLLLARLAEMYQQGGFNLNADPQKAGDFFNEAADAAMEAMKGRLANQYYMKAEEAWSMMEE